MGIADKEEKTHIFLECSEKEIEVISDYYIPFQTSQFKADIRKKVEVLKKEIQCAVKELNVKADEILLAQYYENKTNRQYDIENRLFYNIGTGAFSKCCQFDVAFTGDDRNLDDEHSDTEETYYYNYKIIKINELETLIEKKKMIACWNDIPIDTQISQSAARYYWMIRKNFSQINVVSDMSSGAKVGLRLRLTVNKKLKLMSTMKPLLDGVICAFHGAEKETVDNICSLYGKDKEKYVIAPKLNLLGERNYFCKYRGLNSYRWNPEDERLKFVWITLEKGDTCNIQGELFEW